MIAGLFIPLLWRHHCLQHGCLKFSVRWLNLSIFKLHGLLLSFNTIIGERIIEIFCKYRSESPNPRSLELRRYSIISTLNANVRY